ncbi:LysR family transcriptional regulator [Kiloniella sp. b19]|uniref:LysR family transcriptional regulator n=1 Tax=Kiloniella sp. GXU_MW_B19 TaxID=3141326 RepID=UPI0031D53911
MNEPLEKMAIFAAIAEHGSFTGAAQALGRSKSHVSASLSRLEEELGLQLMHRTTRSLSLTEAGKVYLKHCQELVRSAAEGRQAIRSLQEEMVGHISISASPSFGETHVYPLLSAFKELYPQVTINLDQSDGLVDLKSGDFDLAFRGGRVVNPDRGGHGLDPDLVAIPLVKGHMIVVATPDYLAAEGTPHHPDDLRHHNCIGTDFEVNNLGWPFLIDGEIKRRTVPCDFTVQRNSLIKIRTLQSHGIGWMPSYILDRELRAGELVLLLTDYQSPPFDIYLTYAYQKVLPLRQRRLVDFIKAHFADMDTIEIR